MKGMSTVAELMALSASARTTPKGKIKQEPTTACAPAIMDPCPTCHNLAAVTDRVGNP